MHERVLRVATTLTILTSCSMPAQALEWLYVSLTNNSIVRYDVSLGSSALVSASADTYISGGNLNNPWGMAFASNGDLFVANGGASTILRYDSARVLQETISGNMNFPVGLALDSTGNVYVSNFNGNTITKFQKGSSTYSFAQSFTGNMTTPYGIAFNSSNLLYVANQGTGTGTNTVSIFNTSGTFQGNISTNVARPTGLTIDTNGNIYVANTTGNTVTKYNSSNSYLSSFTGNINAPRGVQVDSLGNLYVANVTGTSVAKFNSSGSFQFSWTLPASPKFMAMVPEPSTYLLAAIAAISLALLARRGKLAEKVT